MGNFHEDMFYSAYLTYLCLKVHSLERRFIHTITRETFQERAVGFLNNMKSQLIFWRFFKNDFGFCSMKNLEIVLLNSITHPIHSFPTTMNDINDHSTTMYKWCFGAFLNHLPTYVRTFFEAKLTYSNSPTPLFVPT